MFQDSMRSENTTMMIKTLVLFTRIFYDDPKWPVSYVCQPHLSANMSWENYMERDAVVIWGETILWRLLMIATSHHAWKLMLQGSVSCVGYKVSEINHVNRLCFTHVPLIIQCQPAKGQRKNTALCQPLSILYKPWQDHRIDFVLGLPKTKFDVSSGWSTPRWITSYHVPLLLMPWK